MSNHIVSRERPETEFTLAELRGASARMAPHWSAPRESAPSPVPPSRIHGVIVAPASARLIEATAEYGG
jgi:hypothetical protein